MFNTLEKTVTCDECQKSISVKGPTRRKAIQQAEEDKWLYSGVGMFWCPKCKGKKK